MKVRMLKKQVGPAVRRFPSEVVDLPAEEALRMVAAGIAEAIAEAPQKKARKATVKKAQKRG